MALIRLNNQSISSVTALPSGIPTGKVLQVVQTIDKNQGSWSLATDTLSTWMTVNITPSSTSSKIFVTFDVVFGNQSNEANPYVVLRRDGSDIYRANTAGSRKNSTSAVNSQNQYTTNTLANSFLDSPSSTSQLAYTLNVGGYSSRTFYKNIPDSNGDAFVTSCSQITVMEIAS